MYIQRLNEKKINRKKYTKNQKLKYYVCMSMLEISNFLDRDHDHDDNNVSTINIQPKKKDNNRGQRLKISVWNFSTLSIVVHGGVDGG